MIEISKEANPNYLCKIVRLKGLQKHINADRLQTVNIDFQTVITGMDAKEGDIYVYFPVECKINKQFLSHTNSFRNKELNKDKENAGFFEENCRVKAMKLRGEKSMGYIVPVNIVEEWAYGKKGNYFEGVINQEFDTINKIKLVEKFILQSRNNGGDNNKKGKQPKLSRLIDGQIHLHTDTENLRKNAYKVNPNDRISITYKTHGTSWWVSNVIVKKDLTFAEKILKKLGFNILDKEYDLIYGSRRVVKNKHIKDPKAKDHYFGYDLWEDIKNEVGEHIPKGYTLYGECLGYDKNGSAIQGKFDYGCSGNEHKLEVYRITHTNEDGLVTELSYPEIAEFCNKTGLKSSFLHYYGVAKNLYPHIKEGEHWNKNLIQTLEEQYNEHDCFMCNNKVPEEGIVLRVEKLFSCEAYKLKSFRFLEYETKQLDKGETNIEDNE